MNTLLSFLCNHLGITHDAMARYAPAEMAKPAQPMDEAIKAFLPVADSADSIRTEKTDSGTDLFVYGLIVPDSEASLLQMFGQTVVSDLKFNEVLAEQEGTVNLRINSPGGAVWALSSMLLSIRNYRTIAGNNINTTVDGVAASAASVLALTGDTISMAELGQMMIHRAHTGVMGNAVDMEKRAQSMRQLDETVAGIYAEKTGKPLAEVLDMMTEETWFSSSEAKASNLVDTIIPALEKRDKRKKDKMADAASPPALLADWASTVVDCAQLQAIS